MDVSKAKRIITPAGELKCILSGGVVIWKKPVGEYKIIKDGEIVAELTLTEFINAIHSGEAKENWGIGARLNTPQGPSFYFGTFTAYGEGKLGLYACNAAKSKVPYGPKNSSATAETCTWSNSYIKKWLNASDTGHGITVTGYKGVSGYCSQFPKDFVNKLNTISTFGSSSKFFLLSANQQYASVAKVEGAYGTKYRGGTDDVASAWELWKNRIVTIQKLDTTSSARKTYNNSSSLCLPTTISYNKDASRYGVSGAFISYHYVFDENGKAKHGACDSSSYSFYPACVIG